MASVSDWLCRLCAQVGKTFGPTASGAPTTKTVVSATVIVLLPLVAPELMETQLPGRLSEGGHVDLPIENIDLLWAENKIVRSIPAPRRLRLLLLLGILICTATRNLPSGM